LTQAGQRLSRFPRGIVNRPCPVSLVPHIDDPVMRPTVTGKLPGRHTIVRRDRGPDIGHGQEGLGYGHLHRMHPSNTGNIPTSNTSSVPMRTMRQDYGILYIYYNRLLTVEDRNVDLNRPLNRNSIILKSSMELHTKKPLGRNRCAAFPPSPARFERSLISLGRSKKCDASEWLGCGAFL